MSGDHNQYQKGSASIDTGGTAFPSGTIRESRPAHDPGAAFHVVDRLRPVNEGISIRDYFAAKAIQGMLAAAENYQTSELAVYAYDVADAMLEARK